MTAAITYTEVIPVRISVEQCEEIERQLGGASLSASLRDAALRVIRRPDLVVTENIDEPGRRQRARRPDLRWIVTPVRTTTQQKLALASAAAERGSAVSALLVESLRFELGLEPREATGGWRLGQPRTGPLLTDEIIAAAKARGYARAKKGRKTAIKAELEALGYKRTSINNALHHSRAGLRPRADKR